MSLRLPVGVTRTARQFADRGYVILPRGRDEMCFTPQRIHSRPPDPDTTPWPMGKSLTATLIGRLVLDGTYDLWQPAPVAARPGDHDPRLAIRIEDLMRISGDCASSRHRTRTAIPPADTPTTTTLADIEMMEHPAHGT